jgi:uncharacterized protein YbcI
MIISRLEPRNRALFLIYHFKNVKISSIIKYFNDRPDIEQTIDYLVMDNTLKKNSKGEYSIDQYKKSNFLKIVIYFFEEMEIPKSKSELNKIFKTRELVSIYTQLLQSQVLMEYINDISNREYILPTHKKDIMIERLNSHEFKKMECSDDFDLKSRFIMSELGEDIRSRQGERVNCYDISLTKDEKCVIVNMYDDIKVRNLRMIGKSKEEIIRFYFEGDIERAYTTIHSLIHKKILRCTLLNSYYINESIVSSLQSFYNKNKKLLVR